MAARDFKGNAFMMTFSFHLQLSLHPVQLSLRYNQGAKKGRKQAEIGERPESPGCALDPAESFPSPDTDEEKPPKNHMGPFNSSHDGHMPPGATISLTSVSD